jgi:hypothetical protein
MSILAGQLETGDWRELRWGRLNPQRSSDEVNILARIEERNISEAYNNLLGYTLDLMASEEFDRLVNVMVGLLDDRPVLHEGYMQALAKVGL